MRVQIATRHVEVPQDVRDRAVDLIQKLDRFDSDVLSAEVIFEEVKLTRMVEGILSVANAEPVVATGESEEWLGAVDELEERLGRMLRRRREKLTNHHPRGS